MRIVETYSMTRIFPGKRIQQAAKAASWMPLPGKTRVETFRIRVAFYLYTMINIFNIVCPKHCNVYLLPLVTAILNPKRLEQRRFSLALVKSRLAFQPISIVVLLVGGGLCVHHALSKQHRIDGARLDTSTKHGIILSIKFRMMRVRRDWKSHPMWVLMMYI